MPGNALTPSPLPEGEGFSAPSFTFPEGRGVFCPCLHLCYFPLLLMLTVFTNSFQTKGSLLGVPKGR